MKYLSKLLSMFLVGMMLVATGCTDYDQDIKNLQNDVNELESQLNGKLATLDTKLDTVEESLTKAIDAAKTELDGKLKTAVDELKAADQKNENAIAAANKDIAAAVERIAVLETELDALTKELEDLEGKHDADIKAVRDELATQIAAVNTKIADEVAKVNSAIDEANKKIAANEGAIDALEEKDVELAQSIKDAFDAIEKNAEAIEKNAEAIQKNADDILANANAISVNADAIDALESSLLELTNNYAAYKAATDAAIAVLESRMDTAEAAIVELEKAVEELYSLHDVQGALIENLDGRLEEFMQYVEDQFAVLAAADKALNDLIVNLENSFIDYQKIVNEQFTKAFAQIAANTAAINALAAKHEEEVKSLMAQDAAILATLDQHVAWMVELEESISAISDRVGATEDRVGATEALIGKIQTNIAAMQVSIDALVNDVAELEKTLADFQKQVGEQIARIDAAIKSALVEAKEYTDARHEEAKGIIDALQTTVERELGTIKTALDDVNAYAKAIDQKLYEYIQTNNKALEGLRKTIEEVKNDLINNHIKPLEVKLDQFIESVKSSLANIENQFSAINDTIVALQEVDKRQDAAIQKATEDILANLAEINILKSQLQDLEGKHNADINALREELKAELKAKADEILATLEAVRVDLWDALTGHEKHLNDIDGVIEEFKANFETLAETIETIQDTISGIQGQLGKVETTIGAMQTSIDILTNDLLGLTESFVAYQAKTDAAISTLNDRMDAAEGAITALQEAIVDLNEKHNAQQAILEGHTTDIEDIKKFVTETTATLTEVAGQISTLVANLGELSGRVDDIYAELTKAIGANAVEIQKIRAELEAEIAARKADDTAIKEAMKEYLKQMATFVKEHTANELKALEEKINKRISELEKRVGELETNLANLEKDHAELENTVKEAIQNLTDIINTAIENAAADAKKKADTAEENAKKFAEELAIQLSGKLDALKSHLVNVEAFAKQTKNELDEYKKATDAILGDLQNQINAIKNRVQSIVFVPEYSDGKGTINYAMAGATRVESRSMMIYQVYPADCATAIADAFGKNPESLTYNFEGLKTRSSEPEFNVVEVKAGSNGNGRLYVTFETRNLGEDFYAGKMEYALSLVHHTEIVNLSTVYTNVVPAAEYDEISMAIMYGDEAISGHYNPVASNKNLAYKFQYTDTTTVVDVLPEHYVAFTVAGKTYKGIKELNAAGYALELKCDNYIHRDYYEQFGKLPFDVTDDNEDGILEVKVAKIDGELIHKILQVGYTYTAGTLKSTAYSDFVTVPVQAAINFEDVSANWTYSLDAYVDSINSGTYTRVLPLTVVDHNLPEDVKNVFDVIALEPQSIKVTLNGEETSVAAKLIAKGEKMFLEIANFAWDKTYDIEAMYSVMKNGQPVVEATAKIEFNTTDRNREPITINFEPAFAKFAANLQLTNEFSDNMDVAYELLVFGNEKNYDIDCDKYLNENFVAGYTYVDTLLADGKKVTVDDEFNTMLAIDGVNNGKYIYTAFCYDDFDNFVPTQVKYTKTVTTWYGQEFIINKVLNFEFPVYDFDHNPLYVFGTQGNYYSQVQPHYNWETSKQVDDLMLFDVDKVQLPVAFNVVDADGKKLTAEQMNNLKLTIDFVIEDNEHPGIYIDPTTMFLSYYGAKDQVNVKGRIFINNDNGTRYAVPTSFDEGKYESYHVRKFNPLTTPVSIAPESKPITITVDNAIMYDYASTDGKLNLWQYIEMFDKRGYPVVGANGWVIGTGANGFASGMNVSSESLYRIQHSWNNSKDHLPAHIAAVININDGMLSFDNRAQLELTGPFTVPVTLTITNIWMESYDVTVFVQFKPVEKQN